MNAPAAPSEELAAVGAGANGDGPGANGDVVGAHEANGADEGASVASLTPEESR